ncbi:MAG: spondin domain-containing protein [Gemmatimonadota bacterium]
MISALALMGWLAVACEDDHGMMGPPEATTFTVTIEAVSQPGTIVTDRAMGTVPLSPGIFAIFTGPDPAFMPGQASDTGSMLIAEDGFPSQQLSPPGTTGTELETVQGASNVIQAGVFQNAGGMLGPALEPGSSATFTFEAEPGDQLQIETMFVQSNDWFYGFSGGGLELFNGDTPVTGDVTGQLALYDAGTEVDTPPGTGDFQKPAQDPEAVDVGPAENVPIATAEERHPGFDIPATSQVIRVTITAQ